MLPSNSYLVLVSAVCVVLVCNAAASTLRGLMLKSHRSLVMTKRQHDQPEDHVELGEHMIHQDEAEEDQQMCFTIPHLQVLKEQFANYIDANHDERASPDEVMHYLRNYNPDITQHQVREFIARRDKDGDGSVDFIPDYLIEVSAPDFDLNAAKEWFTLEDTNRDGYVSKEELMKIAQKVGMSPEEVENTVLGYYMGADTNGDMKLSWKEYMPLFLAAEK